MKSTVVIIAVAACCAPAAAEPIRCVRGLAGRVEIGYAARLRARAEQSPLSPVLVRVSPIAGTSRQSIEFIGSRVGDFDLRDYLEREDGQPAGDLAAIPVTIISQLPADHGTDLYATDEAGLGWRAHYRQLLWAAGVLWLFTPIVYFILRALRRKAPIDMPVAAPREPTIEDLLRAALAVAASRPLKVEEQGRLELLVMRYFADRMNRSNVPTTDRAGILRAIRESPDTRELVMAVERWLHVRGGEARFENAAAALEDFRRSRLSAQPSADDAAVQSMGGPA